MPHSRENLAKLLNLVSQIANEAGNEWLLQELQLKFGLANELGLNNTEKSIKKIYELCVKEIIQKQAQNFYYSFKIDAIKTKLEIDFVRMEHFRRDDNFEDFSLALHQQIENIINHLTEKNEKFRTAISSKKDELAYQIYNKTTNVNDLFNLYQLIVPKEPINTLTLEEIKIVEVKYAKKVSVVFSKDIFVWEYPLKLRAVLYYFVFKQKIYNYFDFKSLYGIGNDIYQARNLNHRGGFLYPNQKETLNRIEGAKDKYYFKFLGFLETLTTNINDNL